MGESSDSVSIDIDMIPLGGKVRNSAYPTKKKEKLFFFCSSSRFFFNADYVWVWGSFVYAFVFLVDVILQECLVKTSKGSISVFVCGDQEKPALITYPDVALNCMSHFLFLFCKLMFLCLFLREFLVGSCSFNPYVDYECIFQFFSF